MKVQKSLTSVTTWQKDLMNQKVLLKPGDASIFIGMWTILCLLRVCAYVNVCVLTCNFDNISHILYRVLEIVSLIFARDCCFQMLHKIK